MPASEFTTTTGIAYIPDHKDRAVAELLQQYRDDPNWCDIARAFGASAQLLEDQLFQLIVDRYLFAAKGAQLDQWGEVVGAQRQGLTDNDYRRVLLARIAANRSGGSPNELIAIFATLTAPSVVRYTLIPPAHYYLTAERGSELSPEMRRAVARVMADANPAGIGYNLFEALPGPFGYDGPPALGYDVGTYIGEIK